MQAYTNTNGAERIRASKRSSQPPWPGIMLPESLTSTERFINDSTKSPNTPEIAATNAKPIHIGTLAPSTVAATQPIAIAPSKPPKNPSQDFLGEIRSKRR